MRLRMGQVTHADPCGRAVPLRPLPLRCAMTAAARQAVETMIEDIQKGVLLPKQKDAFLCCAKCCDTVAGVRELESWCGGRGRGGAASGR